MPIEAVICDIEGTTTSISFVKDQLFPYAYENCQKHLADHFDDPEVRSIVEELQEQAKGEQFETAAGDSRDEVVAAVTRYVQQLISEDRKVKAMKQLQGLIWKAAYASGQIKGHVFEDVARNFKKWTAKGARIFIYSSGSVPAQQLLFGHSQDGDLRPFLSGYFDTNVGHKQERESYENILREIGIDGGKVLFLSDIFGEVKAAKEAGMTCAILLRPGNAPLTEEQKKEFKLVSNFDEIEI